MTKLSDFEFDYLTHSGIFDEDACCWKVLEFAKERYGEQVNEAGVPYPEHIANMFALLQECNEITDYTFAVTALQDIFTKTATTKEEIHALLDETLCTMRSFEGRQNIIAEIELLTRKEEDSFAEYITKIFTDDGIQRKSPLHYDYYGAVFAKLADIICELRELRLGGNAETEIGQRKIREAEEYVLPWREKLKGKEVFFAHLESALQEPKKTEVTKRQGFLWRIPFFPKKNTENTDAFAKTADKQRSPFPLVRPARRMAIAASFNHVLGLCADGSVVATGSLETGQRDVEDWKDIVAVSAGYKFSVGLRADGTVVATGDNQDGQCDVGDWREIVAVSAGYNFSVGLRADGSVVAVGYNKHGQCDVSGWQGIVAIAAGACTLGLRRDGSVVVAGCDEYYCLTLAVSAKDYCRDIRKWQSVAAIDTRYYNSAVLFQDGCVAVLPLSHDHCWDIREWRDVAAIAVGYYHMVALLRDGRVVATGRNTDGCCNVQEWRGVTAIAAGCDYTVGLLADGSVVAVGLNDHDQCGASRWQLAQPGGGLERPSVHSKDPFVRLKMTQEIDNQDELKFLAADHWDPEVRKLATNILKERERERKLAQKLNAVIANEPKNGSSRDFLTESLDDIGLLHEILMQKNCNIDLAMECIQYLCKKEGRKEDALSLAETLIGRVRQESSPKSLKPIVSYFCGQFSDDELKRLGVEIHWEDGYWKMAEYYQPTKIYFEGELLVDQNILYISR
jgi:alpha-tubulin suppressor-like RCC1 family protein